MRNGKLGVLVGGERSIVRRSLLLQGLYSIGFLCNFGTIYSANYFLDASAFGIFYFSYTLVVILIALVPLLNLYLSAYLAEIGERHGETAVWAEAWQNLKQVTAIGGAVSLLAILALSISGSLIGISAYHVVILAVLIAFSCYLTEIGRIVYQGLRRTPSVGLYGLAWMAVRFLFVTIAVFITESVWGGLVGFLLSGPAVFLPVLAKITRLRYTARHVSVPRLLRFERGRVVDFLTFGSTFSLFVFLAYMDVALAYLKFDPAILGQYSASNVIPKGILAFTLPILQVAFPSITAAKVTSGIDMTMVVKGIAITLVLAGSAIAVAYLGEPVFCGGYGISGCDAGLMRTLLIAVIPLCVIRLAITIGFATGIRLQSPILAALVVMGGTVIYSQSSTVADLATYYAATTVGVMILYLLVAALPTLFRRHFAAR